MLHCCAGNWARGLRLARATRPALHMLVTSLQECDRPNSAYMLFYERAEPEPAGVAAGTCGAAQHAQQDAAAPAPHVCQAPAGEDTPMPTPASAEGGMLGAAGAAAEPGAAGTAGAAGAAGAGQSVEGGVQPMALSPAPSFNDRAAEQPVAAAAGTGGGEQPPAPGEAQQQGGGPAGAAGARQQLAPAGAYGMPRQLYETIVYSNLRQLSQMQLLSVSSLWICSAPWATSAAPVGDARTCLCSACRRFRLAAPAARPQACLRPRFVGASGRACMAGCRPAGRLACWLCLMRMYMRCLLSWPWGLLHFSSLLSTLPCPSLHSWSTAASCGT